MLEQHNYTRANCRAGAKFFSFRLPILLALAVAGFCGFLLIGATFHGATEMRIPENARDVDLGKLEDGQELTHLFVVRNTSKASLKITSIQKTCGCQKVDATEGTVVPAGEALQIRYSLPHEVPGVQSGRLTITTDSTEVSLAQIVFNLRGEIPAKIWATPSLLSFDEIREGDSAEQEFRVQSIVPGLLQKLREITSSRGLVTIDLKDASADVLVFRASFSSDSPEGDLYDLINMKFDDPVYPKFTIQVRAHKLERFAVIPKVLSFQPFANGLHQIRHIRVMSAAHEKFRITHIDCPANIAANVSSDQPRDAVDLTLDVTAPTETDRSDNGNSVTLHTEPTGKAAVAIEYAASSAPIVSVEVSTFSAKTP